MWQHGFTPDDDNSQHNNRELYIEGSPYSTCNNLCMLCEIHSESVHDRTSMHQVGWSTLVSICHLSNSIPNQLGLAGLDWVTRLVPRCFLDVFTKCSLARGDVFDGPGDLDKKCLTCFHWLGSMDTCSDTKVQQIVKFLPDPCLRLPVDLLMDDRTLV